MGRRKNFTGQNFWATGILCFHRWKRMKKTIREYIKKQEKEDQRLDQLNMFENSYHLQVVNK